MAIAFSCSCGRKINAKDEHAGKRVKCPGCQQPITVPKPAAANAAAAASVAASRKPARAKAAPPRPADEDMYDIRDDAPPAPRQAGAPVAPASPWGDDDPGLDTPVAAPRPYMPSAGAVPGGARTGHSAAGAAPGGAAAGGAGGFAALGSRRGAAPPEKGGKAGGLHLGPFAKFLIGAAIILPTTFFIFKQGPVKAVSDWEKAGPAGEDDTRTVLMRVIHEMDVATMPPPDPDRDNEDGIPYHPQVSHFYYPDEPTIMWRMPDKVYVQGDTSFGPYEGWYFTRDRRVECEMEWKNGDKLKLVGQLDAKGNVQKLTIDGIDCMDHAALKKKYDAF